MLLFWNTVQWDQNCLWMQSLDKLWYHCRLHRYEIFICMFEYFKMNYFDLPLPWQCFLNELCSGKVNPNDPFWNSFSTISLTVSVGSILLAEVWNGMKHLIGTYYFLKSQSYLNLLLLIKKFLWISTNTMIWRWIIVD